MLAYKLDSTSVRVEREIKANQHLFDKRVGRSYKATKEYT